MSAQDPDLDDLRISIEPRVPSRPELDRLANGGIILNLWAHPTVQVRVRFDSRVKMLEWLAAVTAEVNRHPGGAGLT